MDSASDAVTGFEECGVEAGLAEELGAAEAGDAGAYYGDFGHFVVGLGMG